MNAEWPTARLQMEDQTRPPGYRHRYMAEHQIVDIFPTDRMCNVIALARHEAQGRNSNEICTSDILYGIAKEGSGVAAHVLRSLNIILAQLATVPWTIEGGRSELASLTGEARRLVQRAEQKGLQYRKQLHDEWPPFAWYGTEHVLLAMPIEPEETGARLLLQKLDEAGHTTKDLQDAVSTLLGDVAM